MVGRDISDSVPQKAAFTEARHHGPRSLIPSTHASGKHEPWRITRDRRVERTRFTESYDGGWGIAGHANTNKELVALAQAALAR